MEYKFSRSLSIFLVISFLVLEYMLFRIHMNIGFGKDWSAGNVQTQLPVLDSGCMHLQPGVYLRVQSCFSKVGSG